MSRDTLPDTIAAIATAPGRSALAIVRLSGARAHSIGQTLVRPWPTQPRHATLAHIHTTDGSVIDQGIVTTFTAPASFTGEDLIEVTCHGGPIGAASIIAAFVAAGARPAEPGEFTRRAVLNGKLDLVQAEAIGDLVDAGSRPARQVALQQLDGGLSRRINGIRDRIVELEALIAYDIDFPEEDDGPVPPSRIAAAAELALGELDALLASAPMGEVVREGAVVVIAGAPNVGKSSLFNALLGRRRAIVTDVPGTTRDALEAVTEAEGWPIRLIDTAGLRETSEVVERLGIEVSREYLERADVVLACGDSERTINDAVSAIASSRAQIVRVRTKADLAHTTERSELARKNVRVSAETGEGLAELTHAVAAALERSKGTLSLDAPLVTRERHRVALEGARAEIRQFVATRADDGVPAVVGAVHLREAGRHLEELIGVIDVEQVLDRVFRTFCVGK